MEWTRSCSVKNPTQIETQQETIDFSGRKLEVDMVKDEDHIPYSGNKKNINRSGVKTERVMIFFSNGTYEEYVKG